ncbi:MAG TPA: TldD/PmbA family protein [Elusimicrobiales bacterium]|nr:TldD/PmbA family protein [Elusimicrobiales bacterium]
MNISDINLKTYFNQLKTYSELRIQQNKTAKVTLLKGDMTLNDNSVTGGMSARVYKDGWWGFSSTSEISTEMIPAVILSASTNARFFAVKSPAKSLRFPEFKVNSSEDLSGRVINRQSEIIEFVKEIDNYINKKYPNLDSRIVSARCLDMEKKLITSDGTYAYSLVPRANLIVVLSTSDKDGCPIEIFHPFGGLGRFSTVFPHPQILYGEIDKLYQHLSKKRNAIYPKAGICECILDNRLAGILSHEAIGHTVEADLVLSGSVAKNALGKTVASPLITMIDFANEFNGKPCPCPIYVDDEGVPAKDAVLIEKGILKGFMNNRETALKLNQQPLGNARAFRFSDEPLIRMRNTAILPGTSKINDMISSVKDGYYLIAPSNGQADSTGEFMFGVTLGYEIKNGKLTNSIKDTTISGIAFNTLKTVTMVSDDILWETSGMCGKKQSIPVGTGGPSLKCKIYLGGK